MDGHPPGETNIAGDANVHEGDFVGRDKIVQNIQLDLDKVISVLKQTLPDDDPTPQYLLDTLKNFQLFHAQLHEWKELHNFLNDILIAFGPFARQVDQCEISGEAPNPRLFRQLWQPISQKVNGLLEWGKTITQIGQPFLESEQGLQGSRWFVDLCVARYRLSQLLKSAVVESGELVDACSEFGDKAETHMFVADRNLRETADELYSLSRVVLGSLHHEQIQRTAK
jgi:hypothetical protein